METVKGSDWVDIKIWIEGGFEGKETFEYSIPFSNLFEDLENMRHYGFIVRPDRELPELSATVYKVEICGQEIP